MDKVTLREAFKSIEDVTDEIFDAFEQPEVKVINKKKLNESKQKLVERPLFTYKPEPLSQSLVKSYKKQLQDICDYFNKAYYDYNNPNPNQHSPQVTVKDLVFVHSPEYTFDKEKVSKMRDYEMSPADYYADTLLFMEEEFGNSWDNYIDYMSDTFGDEDVELDDAIESGAVFSEETFNKILSNEEKASDICSALFDKDYTANDNNEIVWKNAGAKNYRGEEHFLTIDLNEEAKIEGMDIEEYNEYLEDLATKNGCRVEFDSDRFATVRGVDAKLKQFALDFGFDEDQYEDWKDVKELYGPNGGPSSKAESLDESEQLDEKLPKDLAKAYRQAPVEFDRIGFTGVGSKYKDYDKYGVTLKNRDTRRNVKTDYANSEYEEITPEEALQAQKDGNIGKLRILIDGDLVQYRNDGYPLVGPELGYRDDRAYETKAGKKVYETRKMPFKHVIKIADKIYLTDEDEHSIGKGDRVFNYDKREWEDTPADAVYTKRQSNQDIEDTGKHNKEKSDNWNRKQANSYKKYIADYKDKLAKLEQKWEAGDISKNDYEAQKASIERSIEWDTDSYNRYHRSAERDEQDIRDNKARRRYQASTDKLQAPLIKLKQLKRDIYYAKGELNDLEKSGLSSYRLNGGSYKEKQSEIAKLKAQIEQAQKRIEQLEKESQGLDDANAKQNADAIEKAQNKVNDIQSQIDTLLRKNKNESLNRRNLKESREDYASKNAQPVLNNVEELIARNGSYNFESVYDKLSIFDWWPNRLSQNHLRQMRGFLREAIKLGYTGYVCFKVGASGCANGMWAHKEPTTTGYSPDGDAIYRSFTPDYTYYSVCVDGKWYPGEDTNGEPYDSCKTTRQLEELISKFNGGKKESLDEDYDYDLCDKVAEVLDNYGIMYGDIVANEDGTVNIVGVDEDEWYEAQDAIYNELGYNVLVPDEDHEEFDDELIVTLDESCKKENKKQLKEATKVDIDDKEDVEKGKEILDKNKESDTEEEMQVVDVDADTVDKLKDSYIGNVLLQCPVCRTPIFKQPDKLVKDEENIADNPDDQLYNVGEQCPHCGQEKGFNLVGQVANMDVDAEEEDEDTTGEEEVEKEDNFEQTTEDDISEEPIEDETEIEDEEDVTFESLDIDKFNNIANTYLTEVYGNVDSFTTTNATVDDENNKLVIEGVINYKSGKTKNTKFEFLGESITKDNKYIFNGLNETFAKGNDKAFTLKASIDNNTLISESLDYDYTVTNTKLNESKVVKGSTLKESEEKTEVKKITTPRGTFEVVDKTEDELRKDGYGYHHSGNGYKIFVKNNQAVAIKE